jgi:hypothetical protein
MLVVSSAGCSSRWTVQGLAMRVEAPSSEEEDSCDGDVDGQAEAIQMDSRTAGATLKQVVLNYRGVSSSVRQRPSRH